MKEAYFENIKNIGNLYIEEILFEANYPVLFTLRDTLNNIYLAVCIDTRKKQRWIVISSAEQIIINMLRNKFTVREAFENSNSDVCFLISYVYDFPIEVVPTKYEDVDELDLPSEGVYLGNSENDFEDYVNGLIANIKP